jgi:hypothetical protein
MAQQNENPNCYKLSKYDLTNQRLEIYAAKKRALDKVTMYSVLVLLLPE